MDQTTWQRVQDLFIEGLEREGDDRVQFVDDLHNQYPHLAAEVMTLMRHAEADASFIERPVMSQSPQFVDLATNPIGQKIGHFEIKGILGEGGMGAVYLAEQSEPIQRQVALKVIRGRGDSQTSARFQAEQQSMAIMDHPAIAKVYEVGTTEGGQSWFAMEYIDGTNIIDFCNERQLTLHERVELFVKVAEGVRHAHQRGVIHRDIKPSNIIVREREGFFLPKIIDFGIAKALDGNISDATLTQDGWIMGTPNYMSPEQARGETVDVRTDVYSLCTTLYEMIVGVSPYDTSFKQEKVMEQLRIVGSDILLPVASRRFMELNEEKQVRVTEQRRTTPKQHAQDLRGDLNWILNKAMAKERRDRYASVERFIADLRRFLAHQTVSVAPTNSLYFFRMRKFIKRHRLTVMTAAAFVLVCLLGAATTTYGFLKASQETVAAEEALAFMEEMLLKADPTHSDGDRLVSARDMLDMGSSEIDTRLASNPGARARLKITMGRVYHSFGDFKKARTLIEEAQLYFLKSKTADGKAYLQTLELMSRIHMDLGDFSRAESEARNYLALTQSREPKVRASALRTLGDILEKMERQEEAVPYLREAIGLLEKRRSQNRQELASSYNSLASILTDQGKYQESEALYRDSIKLRTKALGAESVRVAEVHANLAFVLRDQGNYTGAEQELLKAASITRGVLGNDHPKLATIYTMMSEVYVNIGRFEEAQKNASLSVSILEAAYGRHHHEVAFALIPLANALANLGLNDQAESTFRRVLDIQENEWGSDHPHTLEAVDMLGRVVLNLKKFEEAGKLFDRALAGFQKTKGDKHRRTGFAYGNLGWLHLDQKQWLEAEPMLRKAIGIIEADMGESHPVLHIYLADLATTLNMLGREEEARTFEERAAEIRRAVESSQT